MVPTCIITEGFDLESNPEFLGFLQYAKRSCIEFQSELYMALDQQYIKNGDFITLNGKPRTCGRLSLYKAGISQ